MGKIEDILVKKGLYEPVEISFDDKDELSQLVTVHDEPDEKITIDCYCKECGVKRVFKAKPRFEYGLSRKILVETPAPNIDKALFNNLLNNQYSLKFSCSYNNKHIIYFELITTKDKLIKIGQFPSFADLSIPDIKKYESILDHKLYSEFNRALGLYAHGIGIGSFIYLRRIIETIIFKQFSQVQNDLKLTIKDFKSLSFDKKIDHLKEYLPNSLVKYKNMYAIVSKGVHELTEEECLNYFSFIKNGIEIILDDIVAKTERLEREKVVEAFIAKTTGDLKKEK